MNALTVIPAYGRDYMTRQEVLIDWNNDKDFQLSTTGRYLNKADSWLLLANGYTHISICYASQSKQMFVELK